MKAPRRAAAIPAAKPPTVILRPTASPDLLAKGLEEPEEPEEPLEEPPDVEVEEGELADAEEEPPELEPPELEPPLEPPLELPICKNERKMSICRITRLRSTRTDNEVPHASL